MPHRATHRRGKFALVFVMVGVAALPGCWMPGERSARAQAACVGLVPVSQLPSVADRAFAGEAAAFEALRRLLAQVSEESLYAGRGELRPLGDRIGANGEALLAQQDVLVQAQQAMRAVDRMSGSLLEASEQVMSELLQANASAAEIAAANQLAVLSLRLGKSAAGLFSHARIEPEGVFLLGKDTNAFRVILLGLLDGNTELRLRGAKAGPVRERLLKLQGLFDELRQHESKVLGHIQQLVVARDARASLIDDSTKLGQSLSVYCTGSKPAAPTAAAPSSGASTPR